MRRVRKPPPSAMVRFQSRRSFSSIARCIRAMSLRRLSSRSSKLEVVTSSSRIISVLVLGTSWFLELLDHFPELLHLFTRSYLKEIAPKPIKSFFQVLLFSQFIRRKSGRYGAAEIGKKKFNECSIP